MRSIRTRLWTSHPQVGKFTSGIRYHASNSILHINCTRMSNFLNVNFPFAQLEREGYRVALIDNVHSDIARCINDYLCLLNSDIASYIDADENDYTKYTAVLILPSGLFTSPCCCILYSIFLVSGCVYLFWCK